MDITIRAYVAASDWDAVCDLHDRARPLEVGTFVPIDSVSWI